MLKYLFQDRKFYRTLLILAIPIAAQNFVASTVNMVDTIMIGQLGETEIAAVGQANQLFFFVCSYAVWGQQRLIHFYSPVLGCKRCKKYKKGIGSVSDFVRYRVSAFYDSGLVFPCAGNEDLLQGSGRY